MKKWILVVIVTAFIAGCSNSDSENDGYSANTDNKQYQSLMDKYDAQAARADAQLDFARKQAERYEALLKRWEEQADRYDAILNKWEAQSNTKE